MTTKETIAYVNDKLKKGYSIAKVERELNFGKDTLRQKLNRTGYKYNKKQNQFILYDNTNITYNITHDEKDIIVHPKKIENKAYKDITHNATQYITHAEKNNLTKTITHNITHSKASEHKDKHIKNNITHDTTQHITHTEKQCITQSNNTNVTQPSPRAFTDEDFNILFELIDNYKAKKKNIVIPKNDSEITTRSFRSYKNVFDSFSEYCKNNNLNQKDAIAEALMSFISK